MYKTLKFLHMTDLFSTGTARGARDKYEVCTKVAPGDEGLEAGRRLAEDEGETSRILLGAFDINLLTV